MSLEVVKKSRRGGRQRKCTDAVFDSILALVKGGRSVTDACKITSLSRSAFYAYLDLHPGKKDELKRAAEIRDLGIAEEARQTIRDAFGKSWQAAAWWLERNFPHQYGMNPALRTEEKKEPRPRLTDEELDELAEDPGFRTPSRPIPEPPSGGPVAADLKSNYLSTLTCFNSARRSRPPGQPSARDHPPEPPRHGASRAADRSPHREQSLRAG